MKKSIKILIAAVAILIVSAVAFFGRNIIRDLRAEKIEQDTSIRNERSITEISTIGNLERKGQFIEVDSIHKGSGQASIYKTETGAQLVFEEDFKVASGPDLVVYLAEDKVATTRDLGSFVSLGNLDKDSGKQVYNLPDNYESYDSVVIWCRAFGVLFTAADLE